MGKNNKKVHLIGICGAGMSALAVLLKKAGWKVSGSDSGFYEPVYSYLKKNKISFYKKYDVNNIPKDVDLIVIGNHSELKRAKNKESRRAFNFGKEIMSLPEALAMLSEKTKNIVIAGSYGKSTCTALVSYSLLKAKKDPSYFIGAVPINMENSSHLGGGKDFILEGDEYPSANWDRTSKFLYFNPASVLLISVTHDHINMFPTLKSYKEPYKKLISNIPKNGLLVFNNEEKDILEIIKNAKCKKIGYSLRNKKGWYAKNIKYGKNTTFDLMRYTKKITSIKTSLLGNHNIENIVGVGALLLENQPQLARSLSKAGKKIKKEEFTKAVASFRGIKRRIELKNPKSKIPVYEGFGSSYEKTKVIFNALKLHYPKKRIIAIFEPHTFSWRNYKALKWYKDVFDGVGEIILLPPPTHGKSTHVQLTYDQIYNEIKKHNPVYKAKTEKEALKLLKKIIKKDDIIALVSSGSLLGLSESVPKLINEIK